MAITTIGGTINSTAVTSNLDYKYGPYNSLEEAFNALGPNGLDKLVLGLTVGIIESGQISEYWFKGGLELQNLVKKSEGASAYDIAVDNGFEGTEQEWLASLQGATGNPGHNPNLGTYKLDNGTILNKPASGIAGDYIVVVDETQLPVTAIVYLWDTTQNDFVSTGKDANDAQFASGELVAATKIIKDLTTGGEYDVANAESVKELNESKINKVDTTIDYESVASSSNSNTYIGVSGTVSSSSAKVYFFPVIQGKTYKIKGRFGSSTLYYLYAYYNQDTFLQAYDQYDATTYPGQYPVVEKEILVPTEGTITHVAVTCYVPSDIGGATCSEKVVVISGNNEAKIQSIGDVSELATTEKSTLVGAINEVVSNLGELAGSFNEISEVEEPEYVNLFDKNDMLNGYINTASGNIGSSSSQYKMSNLISVIGGYYYYITGRSSNRGIRCLDSNNTPIQVLAAATGEAVSELTGGDWQLPNVDGTAGVVDGQFKVPSNAKYVQFNVIFNNGDTADNLMLLEVGDSYDVNYQLPSEYVPYGDNSKTVIKEEALPSDVVSTLEEAASVTEDVEKALTRKFKVKILLVGSSHGMNTIAQVPWICYNSTNKLDVEVGNVYVGSMSIQNVMGKIKNNQTVTFKYFKDGSWTTYTGKTFAQVFAFTDWDFISIQRAAQTDNIWLNTQNEVNTLVETALQPVLNELNMNYNIAGQPVVYVSHNESFQYVIDMIKSNATKNAFVMMNSGFADPTEGIGTTQTTAIISTAKDMMEQFGVEYVPVATAIRNARNTYLRHFGNWAGPQSYTDLNAANNLCYDQQHLDYGIGCYVAGMCFLEFICRKLGWDIELLDGFGTSEQVYPITGVDQATYATAYTQPTAETMMVAKACAKCACNTPDAASTKLQSRFKWKITQNLASGITSSNTQGYSSDNDKYVTTYTGTVSSVVVKSRPWDRSQSETTLVQGTDYTLSDGTLTILSIDGDITITVS